MIPDINIKDYYLQYTHNAKIDLAKYKKDLAECVAIKKSVYDYIAEHKDKLKEDFNINLDNFEKEWVLKTYNPTEHLYGIANKILSIIVKEEDRNLILQITKYCNIIRNEHRLIENVRLANLRANIKFGVYRKYITTYYNKVHKCVLKGDGYKFSNGIGVYCINYWKLDRKLMRHRTVIDFAATNAKKKELIAKGIKLYDDKEAAWYKARHIPYDGVDYRVYREDDSFYDITFIKSKLFTNNTLEYQRTEYVASKYRGMSYKSMADTLCATEEDIYNLQVDIKYKLNILLYKDPSCYLNFIRNAEQCKYKRGAHYS